MFSILGGRLKLAKGPENYRPSEDSLWLAGLLPAPPSADKNITICDAACGSGAVGLAYMARHNLYGGLCGFDINKEMVSAAKKSAEANDIKTDYKTEDISNPPFEKNSFALVCANPPFYKPAREMPTQNRKLAAVKFTAEPITFWLERLTELAAQDGYIGIIAHKNDELTLIKKGRELKSGCVKTFDLKSAASKPVKRVVLIFKKGERPSAPASEVVCTYDTQTRKHFLT